MKSSNRCVYFKVTSMRSNENGKLLKGTSRVCRTPMASLASTVGVLLKTANITTADALADMLERAPSFIANFIRSSACQGAAQSASVQAGVQAGVAMCDAHSTMDSNVIVQEVGCTATFSAAGVRLVSKQTQASVHTPQPQLVNRSMQAQPQRRNVGSMAVGVVSQISVAQDQVSSVSMVDASTGNDLVRGAGLTERGVQTEIAVVAASDLEELQQDLANTMTALDAANERASNSCCIILETNNI